MTNEMFEAMNAVADWSQNMMVAGIANGIGPGEEALTDINLIRLAQLIPSMRVQKFAKKAEAANGADWEWWIGSSAEELWLKLRVQAKRSSHDGVRYDQVGHTSKNHVLPQYETLIAQSMKDGAIPFHVFFNGWPSDRFLFDTVRHDKIAAQERASHAAYAPSLALWQSLSWGCTMVSTPVVKRVFEDPSSSAFTLGSPFDTRRRTDNLYVPRYLAHSTPWAFLFRSDTPGQAPTFKDVARNVYRMCGESGDPPDDIFHTLTYRHPSRAAEEAVYGPGKYSFGKSMTTAHEREQATANDLRARAYLQALESTFDFDGVLDSADEEVSGPGYILLTDLGPEENVFMNQTA